MKEDWKLQQAEQDIWNLKAFTKKRTDNYQRLAGKAGDINTPVL